MDNDNKAAELDMMDELDALFGQEDKEAKAREKIVLTQNLEGFANCFPEWDLHPPVKR